MTIIPRYDPLYLCYIESYKLGKNYYGDRLLKVSSNSFLSIDNNENIIFQIISDKIYCQNVYKNQKFTYFILSVENSIIFKRNHLAKYLYNSNGIKLLFKIDFDFNKSYINTNKLSMFPLKYGIEYCFIEKLLIKYLPVEIIEIIYNLLDSISVDFTKISTQTGIYICNPNFSVKKTLLQKILK